MRDRTVAGGGGGREELELWSESLMARFDPEYERGREEMSGWWVEDGMEWGRYGH